MLVVAASARVFAALPKEEDTLSRELGTSPLLETHFPVGYYWQNSRCCRPLRGPQHSHIDDFVSHANDKAQRTRTAETAMIAQETRRRCGVRCSARLDLKQAIYRTCVLSWPLLSRRRTKNMGDINPL
jgi:hypothetical protein